MIILHNLPQPEKEGRIVLLFGTGLIGTSVHNCVNSQSHYNEYFVPFSWNHFNQSRDDAQAIFKRLSEILKSWSQLKLCTTKIAFVWSAGKVGFSATDDESANELMNYNIVLELVRKVHVSFPSSCIFFHLLSSVGGLFEGQRFVNEKTPPNPKRIYGKLKHKQEETLLKLGENITKNIYRPTSVYGFTRPGQRMGLITSLILNGLQNKVSTIFGNLSTLRDYVLNDDIGQHIQMNLFYDSTSSGPRIHLLGSGKPSSIYEIRYIVERAIGKKIYLKFQTSPHTDNRSDITISSSACPRNWHPTDIQNGLRSVKEKILSRKTSMLPTNNF